MFFMLGLGEGVKPNPNIDVYGRSLNEWLTTFIN